jgi:hypothetical protein
MIRSNHSARENPDQKQRFECLFLAKGRGRPLINILDNYYSEKYRDLDIRDLELLQFDAFFGLVFH